MCTDIAGISGQLNFQDIQDFFALGAEIQNKNHYSMCRFSLIAIPQSGIFFCICTLHKDI